MKHSTFWKKKNAQRESVDETRYFKNKKNEEAKRQNKNQKPSQAKPSQAKNKTPIQAKTTKKSFQKNMQNVNPLMKHITF